MFQVRQEDLQAPEGPRGWDPLAPSLSSGWHCARPPAARRHSRTPLTVLPPTLGSDGGSSFSAGARPLVLTSG